MRPVAWLRRTIQRWLEVPSVVVVAGALTFEEARARLNLLADAAPAQAPTSNTADSPPKPQRKAAKRRGTRGRTRRGKQ